MGLVNVTGLSAGFFITSAVFILLILGLFAMGVLRLFQLRYRPGIAYFALGAVTIVVFIAVLNRWFV